MALFNFNVALYAFDQWTGSASTNNTVGYPNNTTFTLNAGATISVIEVQDDDGNPVGSPNNEFDDGYIDPVGDGSSSSTANNDQVLTAPITLGPNTFQVGDQVELEFAFTTTSGDTFWMIRIDNINVGISGPTLPTPGTTYTVNGSSDGQDTPIPDIPCFTDGAMVETPTGPVAIEALKPGDLVTTLDNGAQPIRWVGKHRPSDLEFQFFDQLRPIVISQGALGAGLPNADLVLSPLHRVLVRSEQAELYFGAPEYLVAAKHLVNNASIYRDPTKRPTYRHLLLDAHEILIVNGTPTESLYPAARGAESMFDMELWGHQHMDAPKLARPSLRGFETALLTV